MSGYANLKIDGICVGRARVVLERKLGRPLLIDEEVHHLNGNKLDDREENLVVMNRYEHKILHLKDHKFQQNERGRKIPPDDNLSWCSRCKQFRDIKLFSKNMTHWNGLNKWCTPCKVAYNKDLRRRYREQYI